MKQQTLDPDKFGVSFSLKQCWAFQVDPKKCMDWLLRQGWRRFRLMSYWNEHEIEQGTYDFAELDWQLAKIAKKGGVVSLSLGVKQPRWPEYHWPDWALKLPDKERTEALLTYVEMVVERYKDNPAIISWQLENEALLRGFGRNIQIDRRRLRAEYELVKRLDPTRPIIMSTSNGWGLPLRAPRPDIVGFSLYTIMHQGGKYSETVQRPWLHRARAWFIETILRTPVFIHELQAEPWGPKPIWQMSPEQQAESMNNERLARNIAWAKRIGRYPIDLWGAEWWYWLHTKHNDDFSAIIASECQATELQSSPTEQS